MDLVAAIALANGLLRAGTVIMGKVETASREGRALTDSEVNEIKATQKQAESRWTDGLPPSVENEIGPDPNA